MDLCESTVAFDTLPDAVDQSVTAHTPTEIFPTHCSYGTSHDTAHPDTRFEWFTG